MHDTHFMEKLVVKEGSLKHQKSLIENYNSLMSKKKMLEEVNTKKYMSKYDDVFSRRRSKKYMLLS